MTPTLHTYEQAVQYVSELGHARLPQAWWARLEMATAICLHGTMDFDAHGVCRVLSSDAKRWDVVHGSCECEAQTSHPAQAYWCKHRIARGLALKARALLAQQAASLQDAHNDAHHTAHCETSPPDATLEPSATPDAPTALATGKNGGSAPTLPEAPCSANVHVMIGGKDVLVTVRGYSLAEVLPQIEAVVQRYPAPVSQGTGSADGKLCQIHQALMQKNTGKDGKTCYSHKTADGWCKGKTRPSR